jgi:predicted PolB exonuclease-like 3'-5' exonuclease
MNVKPIIFASLSAMGVVVLGLPQIGVAQTSDRGNVQPIEDFRLDNERDPFTGGDNSGFDMFELIHRANLGSSRSTSEFMLEQDENLNDEAANFRARQRELMQQQQQSAPAAPSEVE